MYMHRSLSYPSFPITPYPTNYNDIKVPFIWTGRVDGGDCLVNPVLPGCPQGLSGSNIADLQPRGADCATIRSRRRGTRNLVRQDGGTCPLIVSPGDGSGEPISYEPGNPSPTCVDGCGELCTGYYCLPTPTGTPPDYWDPEDPEHPPITTDLPPLPPNPAPTTCAANQITTSTLVCNGPVASPVCITSTFCTTTRTDASPTGPPPSDPTSDPDSPECQRCATDIGASDCPALPRDCTLDECAANPDCIACNFDCEGIYPPIDDPNSGEFLQCSSDLGASDCPAADEQCLLDECAANYWCIVSKFPCDGLFD